MTPVALHACNPGPMTGGGNWTWLIPGSVPTLIDAGIGNPGHLEALAEALDGAALAQVLVTHAHSDHASGVVSIAQHMKSARFMKMPWPGHDERWPVAWAPVADGERIKAGETSLTAIHTPGHAPDHMCFWHAETVTLFGGDLAIDGTTVYIPARSQGDLAAYLQSLERILALKPARILPAHGPVIDSPAPLLHRYIAHRRRREEQIVATLRGGDTGVDALVDRIYQGVTEALRPRAEETVLAHLRKLEHEGRAEQCGDLWHMIGP